GADIIETNSFNAVSVSLADYKLESLAYEMNVAAARVARRAVDGAMTDHPGRRCFVAGAIGPTTRSASVPASADDPSVRLVNFEQLATAYYEQVRGLVEGGADLLLAETAFDTVNLKAALFAIERYFEDTGRHLPVMASGTIIDQTGRTMIAQTVEAFWNAIS